jgi:hypothetical protein
MPMSVCSYLQMTAPVVFYLSIYLYIYPSIYLSIYPSIYLSMVINVISTYDSDRRIHLNVNPSVRA